MMPVSQRRRKRTTYDIVILSGAKNLYFAKQRPFAVLRVTPKLLFYNKLPLTSMDVP